MADHYFDTVYSKPVPDDKIAEFVIQDHIGNGPSSQLEDLRSEVDGLRELVKALVATADRKTLDRIAESHWRIKISTGL